MRREARTAALWGGLASASLAALIVIGSRNLAHFDAVLVPYTFAILFATFGIAYRHSMWLQRPPTAMYWRRGWRSFLRPGRLGQNLALWPGRVFTDILITRFIWWRGRLRGLTHALIMWGCILAALITFPLVFGWLHFESLPGQLHAYRAVVFGFGTFTFQVKSLLATILFHGLVWASFLVIAGVMLAMRRRMRDEGAAAVQLFDEDFLPLILLFAVSLTGLMLTVSYTWMDGYGYDFIGLLHAVTVIATFLWIPFGKFFHIFQRPAQLGVRFYKDEGRRGEPAACARCGLPFSSRLHVEDLIRVERELGYDYEIAGLALEARAGTSLGASRGDGAGAGVGARSDDRGPALDHYQWICPPCRRASFALAQARLWAAARGRALAPAALRQPRAAPVYVNAAQSQGPLGEEDARNFHP